MRMSAFSINFLYKVLLIVIIFVLETSTPNSILLIEMEKIICNLNLILTGKRLVNRLLPNMRKI